MLALYRAGRQGEALGVYADLRTVLTRFKLELALIEQGPQAQALKEDVDEMQRADARVQERES